MRLSLRLALVLIAACVAQKPAPSATPAPAAARPRALPGWANGAVFYEVFVRSFQDSDGDGKGDLRGLVSRLDYLNDGNPATESDLGVDALWLMPVFKSPSYHGYDTTDYETINPDYGTNDDFARLVEEAHKRGIKIVVDLVLNHTSSKHPWFIESSSSKTSPRRDWYVWSDAQLHWGQPWNPAGETWHALNGAWYYGLFWAGMPDLNFRTPAVREEARHLAALWLARGVDGFRLDAARHMIETGPGEAGQNDTAETHQFWKKFAAQVRAVKPEATLIGEAWSETPIIARYYGSTDAVPGGDELPLNFDFPMARQIIQGVKAGEAKGISDKLAEIRSTYPEGATDVPFLTNHDQRRIASEVKGDAGMLRSAAAVLLTLPGTPFLYYGEELGMENGPGQDDREKRNPMPWDGSEGGGFTTGKPWYPFAPNHEKTNVALETGDPNSLLSRYRKLIRARHGSVALGHGALEMLVGKGPVLAFVRTAAEERVLVVHNLSAEPQSATLAVATAGTATLFVDDGVDLGEGKVALPAHASAVFRLR
jgi:glycosidase